MPGIAMKKAVVKELQRQFNHELSAAHAYLGLASWCDEQNYRGFARFFSKQAAEEREHAQKFIEHLLDRGVAPKFEAVPEPRGKFASLLEVAKHAQAMEQANTQGVNACFEAALREADYPAQVLLHWFINEQVEEEAWTDELIDRVERANCAGGLGELDRHVERHLKEEGVQAAGGAD
jgi:ferritin